LPRRIAEVDSRDVIAGLEAGERYSPLDKSRIRRIEPDESLGWRDRERGIGCNAIFEPVDKKASRARAPISALRFPHEELQ
jgi:hypothetical protein